MTTTPVNIYTALAKAQAQMGKAAKGSKNSYFGSKYADLADVVEACRPALNAQGIAFFHVPVSTEIGHVMKTLLVHGESGTQIECDVPLILGKQDMQGYKSATTYAKRIGLESLTGIAPEDDDGNAAVANFKKEPPKKTWAQTVIQDLPEGATDQEKMAAIADALIAQWRRKRSEGELNNEYDRRRGLIEDLKKRDMPLAQTVIDAFDLRLVEIQDKARETAQMAAE